MIHRMMGPPTEELYFNKNYRKLLNGSLAYNILYLHDLNYLVMILYILYYDTSRTHLYFFILFYNTVRAVVGHIIILYRGIEPKLSWFMTN